jgi:MFS transporter, PPP family, 3-phenylpropionic acid transporter
VGLLWSLGVVAEILLFWVMSPLLARFSLKQILLTSFLLATLRWLLLGSSLADSLPCLLGIQVLHAATFGSFHIASVHFVQHHFGPRQQGQGQALYASVSGVGGALGALYAGYSWNSLGSAWTFGIAALATLAAAVIMATRLHEERA